jgi:diadenosine tetraphosphatase ApaH/serine/threonine PP2A family protein phosphatase
MCNQVFDVMPLAALIDNRVFSVHGGLSKEITRIEQITSLRRNQDLPLQGPMSDLCWSDPEENVREWRPNSRGTGCIFGAPQVEGFCRVNGGLAFITRSHQLVQEGYQWFFGRKLITVWSAPNYTYRCQNLASVMQLTPENYANPTLKRFNARAAARRKKPETGMAFGRSGYFQ